MIKEKKVAAIIAEYNPFHNGHRYHIQKTKEVTGADHVIVLMSSNFVQRGEPAILDRYERAKAAVFNGADAVFELPVTVSTASAETFAGGAVSLAENLKIVDFLAFGTEANTLSELVSCADLLRKQEGFLPEIKKEMAKGFPYPQARSSVLQKKGYVKEAALLSGSNNILGVSYLTALMDLRSEITPVAIKRISVGHNEELSERASEYASAKAIREKARASLLSEVLSFLPSYTASTLKNCTRFISNDDFSEILYYKLASLFFAFDKQGAVKALSAYQDVTPDLAGRILRTFSSPFTYSTFAASLWSRNYNYARIDRILYHIMLDITKEVFEENKASSFCPYIRPLVIKKEALPLLTEISARSSSASSPPLLTRIGDIKKNTSKAAEHTFRLNRHSTALYAQIAFQKHGIRVHDETKEPFLLIV